MKRTDPEVERELDRIRGLPWQAKFWKTLDNPSAPGGKVDMYILIDDDSGEGIVGVSVQHGRGWLADYIAVCCADPYFVRAKDLGGSLASAFNQEIKKHLLGDDGTIDAREVHVAAITVLQAYIGSMPLRSRQELINSTIKVLRQMREAQ